MEETVGANYALQVALQTMKERCKSFQDRITILEEENVNLRATKCLEDSSLKDLSEVDTLKKKVAQLTEQKSQLMQNVLMVATENSHLWNRLSKLTQANETLGGHLVKINDTLKQHNDMSVSTSQQLNHAPLIRSKTFTQETPANKIVPKVEKDMENMSLEDISLKLINSIAREKSELEKQYSQMVELQQEQQPSLMMGFAYPEDAEDSASEEFLQHVNVLKKAKEMLVQHNAKLQKQLMNMQVILTEQNNRTCKECVRRAKLEKEEELQQLNSLKDWGSMTTATTTGTTCTISNSNSTATMVITSAPIAKSSIASVTVTAANVVADEVEVNICPMCSKAFLSNVKFSDFQHHVESHFLADDNINSIDNYEFL